AVSYWELMAGGRFGIAVDTAIAPKPAARYRQIGRKVVARDLAALVRGTARFVHDMMLPDMLHARVVRPPHVNARLAGLDAGIEARLDGGTLVRDGSFLAVAHTDEYMALRLAVRVATAARWDDGGGLDARDIYERLTTAPRVSLPVRDGDAVDAPVPDLAPPPGDAVTTLHLRLERPYVMHASIAPSAAMALFADGALTIWTHSQGVHQVRQSIAEALRMEVAKVRLVQKRGAGCYGHNGADDAALDAGIVARAIPGRPVLLKWTRADEHAWEPYSPAMVIEMRASLDASGRVIDWSHETYSDTHRTRPRPGPDGAGPRRMLATRFLTDALPPFVPEPFLAAPLAGVHRNAWPYYTFPRKRVVKHLVRGMAHRTSTLRSLGACANVMATEGMMDALAIAAGIDPLDFRLRQLDDGRARDVLRTVAERARWGHEAVADGRGSGWGRGLAFARYNGLKAYAAVVADVAVGDDAQARVHRITVAVDAGQVVDYDGLALQIEGAALQAASWTLHEQVTWDRDGITSRDWDSYPILRFDTVPTVEVHILDRPDAPYLGPSECALGPTAAAIANAIRAATGLRLARLPFTPAAIRAAALQ
ncbi:MAG: xanthine dehydrogenase family protein molybdopterin-binding subunit, partial [Alphaproteobacteria bacterium]|nr:xanthine dehydrogenase family protein molybdopterin-binding subunit [Alphaproteobacteria bacterium]